MVIFRTYVNLARGYRCHSIDCFPVLFDKLHPSLQTAEAPTPRIGSKVGNHSQKSPIETCVKQLPNRSKPGKHSSDGLSTLHSKTHHMIITWLLLICCLYIPMFITTFSPCASWCQRKMSNILYTPNSYTSSKPKLYGYIWLN